MAPLPFLDTNVLLRHLIGDVPSQSARVAAFLRRIEQGQERVRTADTVVFETVFTLERLYRIPRAGIRDAVLAILDLPGIVLPGKRRYRRVFDLYVAMPRLSFADCYHVALMRRLGLHELVSFDQGFDAVPSITRKEP